MTAFVFEENPTFRYPVTVQMPTDKGIEEFEFEGHFLLDPDEELMVSERAATPAEQRDQDIEALRALWIGWTEGGIKTPSGVAVEPSEETIVALLQMTPVRFAVVKAYLEATVGGGARLGNSGP